MNEVALPALLNRAAAAIGHGDLAQAEQLCREALARQPALFDALHMLAVIAARRGEHAAALDFHDRALALRPDHPEVLNNRGIALKNLKRFDEAVASYDRAVAARPRYAKALYNRGVAMLALNRNDAARRDFAGALALAPGYAAARLALTMAELPLVYEREDEIAARRSAYAARLADLEIAALDPALRTGLADAIGGHQPYYLAYQGMNDRDLQQRYGTLLCALARERYGAAAVAPLARSGEPIRVGFVSGFFRMQSVWKIPLQGWLTRLDRTRFRIFGYHTGTSDAISEVASGLCERFVRGPHSTERWREIILADAPHVLIYPELGMDMSAPPLAAQRLAPVQCTSWGHPDTSGYPTIDYFLSSALMEPPDGDGHYSEKLIRLPNLSTWYEPLDQPPGALDRARFGLRPGAVLFWCGQTTSKYLPQFDDVFARIARGASDCQFVFVAHGGSPAATDLLRRRLAGAFARANLDAARHCVIIPRLNMAEYGAAMGLCDVFLDSIGWSGANTALESLAHDLPIVTLPGPIMRSRHCLAILKMMQVPETIAASLDEYVGLPIA